MPLLSADTDLELEKGPRATLPTQTTQFPDFLDVAAAAERSSNLVGTLYDRLNSPAPDTPAVPGFDPLVSIPNGYEAHASDFLGATSPDEMEWRRQRIDQELNDQQTIARAHGWGLAATMAAGLTDPVTLASMAIPLGGETRLIQAGRTALAGGATAAVQEAGMQALQTTRTAEDSALNIAASTVLGGVLGAAIRPHVPVAEFSELSDRLHPELHGAGGETVLGPIDGHQRIIPEDSLEQIEAQRSATQAETARLSDVHGSIDEQLAQQRDDLVAASADFVRGNDARAAARELAAHERTLAEATEAHARIEEPASADDLRPAILERMEAEDRQSYGDDYDNPRYTKLRERAATKEAREAAAQDASRAQGEREASQGDIDAAQDRVDRQRAEVTRLQASEQAFKDLKKHDAGIAAAGSDPAARAALIADEEARSKLTAALEPPPKVAAEPPPMPDVPQAITEKPAEGFNVNPNAESTSGAAAVSGPDIRGETIARGAESMAKTVGRVSPGARLMASPSLESRKLVQDLANIPETLTKNYKGIATASPIERELWKYEGVHYEGMQARAAQFKTYRERMAGLKQKPLSREDFFEQIAMSMRRGDKHAIPEVAEAAKQTRAIEFNPLKVRAMANGSLPADVKTDGAESYLMRQYDQQKIRANQTQWLDILTKGFAAQGVDMADARDIAHKASRNILGSERGTMDWHAMDGITPQSGRLKARELHLPDRLLEPFLNNNIDHVAHSYLRSLAPEVEMTDRFGSRDMRDQLANIRDDYARMIERAPDDGAKEDLLKRQDADLRDLTAIRDRLYGIYGQPKDPGHFAVRAGRLLRSENALRMLGGATLSHFPDLGNVILRYGMTNTFTAIGKVLTSPEAFTLTRSEAKRMGAGLDMAMNATASMLGDYASHSAFPEQRVMNRLTRAFTITTLETPLITAVQQLTSTLAQDELVRAAQKVAADQSLDSNLMARMASAGIDADTLKGIAAQHQQFGAKVNGLNFGMSDQWTDQAIASKFESAILRDAHSVTLRPGAGDTPLFLSSEWGKFLRQFTTFGYAAQRSVTNPLLQGLSHADPRALSALFALPALGTLSYVTKQIASGQPIEPATSPRFALEVLDKSNLLGWTADVIFPALWSLGFKNLSRWSDRDPVETLGGPSVGTVLDTYGRQLPAKMIGSTDLGQSMFGMSGENQKGMSRSDLHFIRRLMPGQNLWYTRGLVNQLEDRIGDEFDLPGRSNADNAQ